MSARLRVIAGPNGSGKSSIFEKVKSHRDNDTRKAIPTGPFVNSDQIEKSLREEKFVDLIEYGINPVQPSIIDDYLKVSTLKDPYNPEIIKPLVVDGNFIKLKGESSSAYLGMVVSDLIREELLKRGVSFTMETVFSHPDKLRFMQRAKEMGYRVYLYFVSTDSPEINIKRVEGRVAAGGHDVPVQKIVDRYERTMRNLQPALRIAYRAYIFDNSGATTVTIAEKHADGQLVLNKTVPEWLLKYLEISA